MKSKIKNKKIIAGCIIIIIAIMAICIYILIKNNILEKNVYINIWRDTTMDPDITLYGSDENPYIGIQPTHYLIYENGEVYTSEKGPFQNDSVTVEYVKTLSQSDLKNLENELKLIIENNESDSIGPGNYYYININGNSARVDVNVETMVLNNYI